MLPINYSIEILCFHYNGSALVLSTIFRRVVRTIGLSDYRGRRIICIVD
jgi:hypothetical protein